MQKLLKTIFSPFFDENFFENEEFEKKLLEVKNLLPKHILTVITKIFAESTKGKLNFEETACRFQKQLKKCNLPKNISKVIPLEMHSLEYTNKLIRQKIQELSKILPYFRSIRGDGNCFYRAVGLAFLEQIFYKFWVSYREGKLKTSELIDFLTVLEQRKFPLIKCTLSETSNSKSYRILEEFLRDQEILLYVFLRQCCKLIMILVQSEDFREVIAALEKAFLENHLFDMSLVIVMRSILHFTLMNNLKREEYVPFMVSPDEFLRSLQIFGEEAENILIPISADALKRVIVIHMVHKDQGTGVPIILTEKYEPLIMNEGKEKDNLPVINLYFRPGHYDLGYEKEKNDLLKYFQN